MEVEHFLLPYHLVVEVEEVEEAMVAEGYLQECHLQAEPHPSMESLEEILQPNLMEIMRKAKPFCLHLHSIEE